jgi:dCTP deaminase
VRPWALTALRAPWPVVLVILSDRTLRERLAAGSIRIEPFDESAVQPASIDLRLSDAFRVFTRHKYSHVDLAIEQPGLTELVMVAAGASFALHPGEFTLASTLERVAVPDDLVGRLEGKSSLGRVGLIIHSTAGYVDPGFEGQITLELSNVATVPIMLYPGMRIAQISFLTMTTPAERPYASPGLQSKYQGQTGPTESRLRVDRGEHV